MKELYLNISNFNLARIMNETIKKAIENGGFVVKTSLTNETTKIHAMKSKINSDRTPTGDICYSCFTTWCGHGFEILLNGFKYEFHMDSNPFFPVYFSKIPTKDSANGNAFYMGDYYCQQCEFPEFLQKHDIFKNVFPDEIISEMSTDLFNQLLSTKIEKCPPETRRQRVHNIYDGGYHYENIIINNRHLAKHEIVLCSNDIILNMLNGTKM